MGRPPIQHHKQIVEIGPDLKTALEDGSIRELVVIHEVGQAAKGFLSTNAGAVLTAGGILVTLLAFEPTRKAAIGFIVFLQQQIANVFHAWFNEGISVAVDHITGQLERIAKAQEGTPFPVFKPEGPV